MTPIRLVAGDLLRRAAKTPIELLAVIGERHIPRLLVVTMGVLGALTGLFFILMPADYVRGTWAFLMHGAPAIAWGIVFLAVGAALATAGVIDHTKSTVLCFVEAMIFFGLAYSSLTDIHTWGTRAVFTVCCAFGWISIVGLFATLAPDAKRVIDEHA